MCMCVWGVCVLGGVCMCVLRGITRRAVYVRAQHLQQGESPCSDPVGTPFVGQAGPDPGRSTPAPRSPRVTRWLGSLTLQTPGLHPEAPSRSLARTPAPFFLGLSH